LKRLYHERLARVSVTSPISGVVTAEMSVSEKDIGLVTLGQEVSLKTRAYPDRTFPGKVEAIAPAAVRDEARWGQRFFRVTTRVDNSSLLLRPEMTGAAKIRCDERSILEVLTRRLAQDLRVEFWSWW